MKKYRLQPKNHEKPILTLEVDTENRDWYIDTDDMEGAVQALKNFSSDCAHVHAFFINGKDCTEDVRMISACRVCAGTVQIPGIPTLDSVLPAGAFTPPAGKNGTGKFDGLFLGRRHISGSPVPIQGLTQETDGAVIQGTVVEYDLKDLRDNKKLCILKIADETNGMLCKRFFDKGDDALSLEEYLKPGMTVKLRGNVRIDKFSGDFALQISQMEQVQNIVCVDHEEHSVTPRVELHLHTKMSLDGLIDLERIIKTIARWKHPAVAITDHGVIQAFPKIQDLAKNTGSKLFMGWKGI